MVSGLHTLQKTDKIFNWHKNEMINLFGKPQFICNILVEFWLSIKLLSWNTYIVIYSLIEHCDRQANIFQNITSVSQNHLSYLKGLKEAFINETIIFSRIDMLKVYLANKCFKYVCFFFCVIIIMIPFNFPFIRFETQLNFIWFRNRESLFC